MKIIYSGLQHENYDPRRRESFEYANFYYALAGMPGVSVIEYLYDEIRVIGKNLWNSRLLELVKREKPDLFFAFMYSDELEEKTLSEIKKLTKSVAWFADDSWRFYNYSRHYAPLFTKVVTTYSWIEELYKKQGMTNVIRSQWACNTHLFHPVNGIAKNIDVSFVGQSTPARARLIARLKARGINVSAAGWGWPASSSQGGKNGKLSQEEMLALFERSKINLNINAPPNLFNPKTLARIFFRASRGRIVPDFHLIDNLKSWRAMAVPQQKARSFELAGCAVFCLAPYADDIGKFYEEDKEMVFYRSEDDLVKKIRYYLNQDEERAKIAQAGYERTVREHTYEKRFQQLFQIIGP